MPGNPARVADLERLADIWEDLGLRVLEMPQWRQRGRGSHNTFEVFGVHHTAMAFDIDSFLRDGSKKIPGPLCNVALHANGDVVLVASGTANHFGRATWPNDRSLGVEATGPQGSSPRFPNLDAYERLAAGFCIFKGRDDPRRIVRGDVGIPVRLVAAHKEVAVSPPKGRPKDPPTLYGRKPDPDFEEPGELVKGKLAHGFSVDGPGFRLIDTFRERVHALVQGPAVPPEVTEEEDMLFLARVPADAGSIWLLFPSSRTRIHLTAPAIVEEWKRAEGKGVTDLGDVSLATVEPFAVL